MAWTDKAREAARMARSRRLSSSNFGSGLKHSTKQLLAFNISVTAKMPQNKRNDMAKVGRDLHRLSWGKPQIHGSLAKIDKRGKSRVVTPRMGVVRRMGKK